MSIKRKDSMFAAMSFESEMSKSASAGNESLGSNGNNESVESNAGFDDFANQFNPANNAGAVAKLAQSVQRTCLEKVAGIYIGSPTQENIEDFVRKYVQNELTFFPRILDIGVSFIPSTFDNAQRDWVSEGSGVVEVKIHDKVLELPFLVKDGELMPFDFIQMDEQRAPYSRENFQKILLNLEKLIQQQSEMGDVGEGYESPYAGVDEYNSPATVPGFMSDVLSIRDSQTQRNGTGWGKYVTAGEYDYGFLKQANETPDTLGLGLFSKERRTVKESEQEKAKVEKEKPTTPAPKGTEKRCVCNEKTASDVYDKKPEDFTPEELEEEEILPTDSEEEATRKAYYNTRRRDVKRALAEKNNQPEHYTDRPHPNSIGKKAEPIHTDLDALLEKTASLHPMTDAEIDAITSVLTKKAADKHNAELEKLASDAEKDEKMTRKERRDMENKADLKWRSASDVEHGTFIVFPELKGNEICTTPAVVLSKFMDIKGGTDNKRVVVAQDGRMRVLTNGEKFLCAEAPDKAFKFNTVTLSSLKQDKHTFTHTPPSRFFAVFGDTVLPPSMILYRDKVQLADNGSIKNIADAYEMSIIGNDFDENMAYKPKSTYSVVTLGEHTFDKLNKEEYVVEKAKELVMPEDVILSLMGNRLAPNTLVTDPHTKVIEISGIIMTHMKDQSEYNLKSNMIDAGLETEKVAFSLNTVTVECTNRQMGIYNVTVEYKDTTERLMNLRRQQFNAIKEGKLRAILRIIKFQGNKINEVIYKSKNEPRAIIPIPMECTVDDIKKLAGGDVVNVSTESVKGALRKYVNPAELTKTLATGVASAMIADSVKDIVLSPKTMQGAGRVFSFINKVANDSAELSARFEKLAAEHENGEFLDIAKALAIGYNFSEKLAHILQDTNNVWPSVKDVAHEIKMSKPVLEKFAFDLTSLKVQQQGKETVVDPNYIVHAIRNMDNLYKMAYHIDEAINKDNLSFKM